MSDRCHLPRSFRRGCTRFLRAWRDRGPCPRGREWPHPRTSTERRWSSRHRLDPSLRWFETCALTSQTYFDSFYFLATFVSFPVKWSSEYLFWYFSRLNGSGGKTRNVFCSCCDWFSVQRHCLIILKWIFNFCFARWKRKEHSVWAVYSQKEKYLKIHFWRTLEAGERKKRFLKFQGSVLKKNWLL